MTLEQAREFFRMYNGSSFHMYREDPLQLEQFEALNVSDSQKDEWRLEMAEEYLDKITADNPKSWSLFSSLTTVLTSIKTFSDRQEAMFIEAIEKQTECELLARTITLETVCGRTYDYHDGVIAYFRKQGYDLKKLKTTADKLIEQDTDTDDDRLKRAINVYRSLII